METADVFISKFNFLSLVLDEIKKRDQSYDFNLSGITAPKWWQGIVEAFKKEISDIQMKELDAIGAVIRYKLQNHKEHSSALLKEIIRTDKLKLLQAIEFDEYIRSNSKELNLEYFLIRHVKLEKYSDSVLRRALSETTNKQLVKLIIETGKISGRLILQSLVNRKLQVYSGDQKLLSVIRERLDLRKFSARKIFELAQKSSEMIWYKEIKLFLPNKLTSRHWAKLLESSSQTFTKYIIENEKISGNCLLKAVKKWRKSEYIKIAISRNIFSEKQRKKAEKLFKIQKSNEIRMEMSSGRYYSGSSGIH